MINDNDILLLSTDELLGLHVFISDELKSRAAEELASIEKRRAQLMLFAGTPANAPVDELAIKRERKARQPKYRNPANADETWSGRGKKPGWLAKLIEEGTDPETCRITPQIQNEELMAA